VAKWNNISKGGYTGCPWAPGGNPPDARRGASPEAMCSNSEFVDESLEGASLGRGKASLSIEEALKTLLVGVQLKRALCPLCPCSIPYGV
jgi:hypothetical protein